MPTVANAANEAALKLFLDKKIPYKKIEEIVRKALDETEDTVKPELDAIISFNSRTYQRIISEYTCSK